ncbi:basic-leucine zipper transcription factor f-related [Anaeramoeba flamelloides]|uniref:Basic-leucine zipper transcription factor f-related n=1 Tax=Anaeramoeba flamelloides TaxID=1746091 RepID=A0ABQ8YJN1_9EUKA|nr:basic-leucine zipper transcription factor f-related [Anaeramoeba flamelloides]
MNTELLDFNTNNDPLLVSISSFGDIDFGDLDFDNSLYQTTVGSDLDNFKNDDYFPNSQENLFQDGEIKTEPQFLKIHNSESLNQETHLANNNQNDPLQNKNENKNKNKNKKKNKNENENEKTKTKTNTKTNTKKKTKGHRRALSPQEIKYRKALASISDINEVKKLTKEERRIRRLEQNRESARKTREKKKKNGNKYEQEISQLRSIIQDLKEQMSSQQNEINRLNNFISQSNSQQSPKSSPSSSSSSSPSSTLPLSVSSNYGNIFDPKDEEISDLDHLGFNYQVEENSRLKNFKRLHKPEKEYSQFKTMKKSSVIGTTLFSIFFLFCIGYSLGGGFNRPGSNDSKMHPISSSHIDIDTFGTIKNGDTQTLIELYTEIEKKEHLLKEKIEDNQQHLRTETELDTETETRNKDDLDQMDDLKFTIINDKQKLNGNNNDHRYQKYNENENEIENDRNNGKINS